MIGAVPLDQNLRAKLDIAVGSGGGSPGNRCREHDHLADRLKDEC